MAIMNSILFETGQATTDVSGEVTIFLTCFKPFETPCIIASAMATNTIVNVKDLTLVGSTWTAKLVSAIPNITISYHAFISNSSVVFANLITQDLQDILTQNNETILV